MEDLRIVGPDGRPLRKQELTREVAAPSLTGVRNIWGYNSIASGITPERLAQLLRSAAEGEHRDYLTLAEEMEERDLHYFSVLGTRKLAVSGLDVAVEAASDDARDVKLADHVRELVRRPEFGELLDDTLDALGKGYSAVEIIWDRSGRQWWPERYEWRDPRFFMFDRVSGRELRLLDEQDAFNGVALPPYKFIVHVPRLKSGLPIRRGFARLASLAYMCKAYAITDWMAFAEVFGMPLRIGKYGPGATEKDIRTLVNAVANLGTDAAAVIPESMKVEFEEASQGRGGESLFERLATWWDKQLSKAILGQTASTEGTPGRLGGDDAQDAVRKDILRADARQLRNTLNRDLVRPFIDLNHGAQAAYPCLKLIVQEPEDIGALTDALERLVPLGLRVETSVVRDKLGLPDPEEDAEVLQPHQGGMPLGFNRERRPATTALNRASVRAADEPLFDEIEAAADEWEPQLAPIVDPIQRLADRVATEGGDAAAFLARLPELLEEMDESELVRRLAAAAFTARGAGDATDEG